MNVSANPNQSDTKEGLVAYPAYSNLTGFDNSLVKIVNNNGAANFALPAANTDFAYYVLAAGDVAGNTVYAEVPESGENVRLLFSGTCNPGDALSLNPNVWGQIYKPATGAGSIPCDWVAEEAGVGATSAVPQLLKVRRIPRVNVTF